MVEDDGGGVRAALKSAVDWPVIFWFIVSGLILVAMGVAGPVLKKIRLTPPMFYLAVGLAMGPAALGLLEVDLVEDAKFFEHLTEVAVVISLFATGLKMRMPLSDGRWVTPVALATLTMVVTVGLVAGLGMALLGLSLGMAVLLGAVMAPTDPVLASEVQVDSPDDKDRLRLTLTGEAGLNDGTAFPFVLLGVGLAGAAAGLDLHSLGAFGWKWFVIDVLWKVGGGLLLGWWAGCGLARFALWTRRRLPEEPGADAMLSLGLIALVYGAALLVDTYAFLAVFAAAVALRRVELQAHPEQTEKEAIEEAKQAEAEHEADAPEHAPAILAHDQMEEADTLERLVTVALVVPVGAMLWPVIVGGSWTPWLAALAAILIVRPLAVYLTAWRCDITPDRRLAAAWLGIRGIGTLYYLTHAYELGIADAYPEASEALAHVALATIALSVVVHGLTTPPLMAWYCNRRDRAGKEEELDAAMDMATPA